MLYRLPYSISSLGKFFALVLFLGLGFGQLAEAAKVKKIIKKKRLVIIDEGKKAGIAKGSEICFFDKNGDEIVCGKVTKLRNKQSYVKVRSKKKLKKIKKGFDAEIKSSDGTTTVTSTAAGTKIGDNRSNVKLMYILTPVPPASFKKISFKPPEQNAADGSQTTLWDQTEDSGVSFLGFGLELEFGVGSSMSIALAGRYRAYRDFVADSDYDRTDGTVYAQTDQKATSVGGYLDFYFLQVGGPFFIRLGAGLDLDKTTVSFRSDKLSDTPGVEPTPIGDANSGLTLMSLRVPLQLNYFIGPVGLDFGIIPVVPLAEFGKSFKGLVQDASTSKLTDGDGETDLQLSLDHKKASFGLEIATALYFAF